MLIRSGISLYYLSVMEKLIKSYLQEDWVSPHSSEPRASLDSEPRISLYSEPRISHPTVSAPTSIPSSSSKISDEQSFIRQAERALESARAAQQALEMEERLVLSWLREKEVAARHLQQDVESIRARWQAASLQVGAIRTALLARGVTPREASPPPLDQATIMRQQIDLAFRRVDEEEESSDMKPSSIFPSLAALKGPVPPYVAKPAEMLVRDMASPSQASSSSSMCSGSPI